MDQVSAAAKVSNLGAASSVILSWCVTFPVELSVQEFLVVEDVSSK